MDFICAILQCFCRLSLEMIPGGNSVTEVRPTEFMIQRFTVIAMEKTTRLQLSRKTISCLEDSQISLGVGIQCSAIFKSRFYVTAINLLFYCIHEILKDFVASKRSNNISDKFSVQICNFFSNFIFSHKYCKDPI